MAFDISTAKPVSGFDLSTAKPVVAEKPKADEKPTRKPQQPSVVRSLSKSMRDLDAGLIRGAGQIGATLVAPGDMLADRLLGPLKSGQSRNQKRRMNIEGGLTNLVGANVDSPAYTAGKLTSEIAGTAGMGGVLANGARAVAPSANALTRAIETGGMRAGTVPANATRAQKAANVASRIVGGAATGGASAGLVDQNNVGAGAGIGGALPVGVATASKVLPVVGSGVANMIGGLATGTGGESLKQAARAGMIGMRVAKSFIDNLRGKAPMADALDKARANLGAMKAAKSAEYRQGMAGVSSDKSILDFQGIDNAVSNAAGITQFKGQVKNEAAEKVRGEIAQVIDDWKSLDPGEYHTPEGFDALKQRIGAIVEKVPLEERTAAQVGRDIYQSVRSEIAKQAPVYDKVMKDYHAASDEITEIERTLMGKAGRGSIDSAMRKLQSLTRNNASTNYGNRLDLMQTLERKGGQEVMPALAGQALNTWTPRGLHAAVAGGVAGTSATAGAMGAANPLTAIPYLAATSPRLTGEVAYKLGQGARGVNALYEALGIIPHTTLPVVATSKR